MNAKINASGKFASTGLLFVLVAAMGAGPLFNYSISVSASLLIDQLGITAGQVGYLVTIVFTAAAISSIWMGRLADKLSSRSQMLLIFLGTGFALFVAAFAQNYWLLVVAAILSGPAQAISNPTTNRVVLRAVPLAQRTGWIGIKQSGVQASQFFSGLFFPAVALAFGWMGAGFAGALVCLLLWLISLRYVPSPQAIAQYDMERRVNEPVTSTGSIRTTAKDSEKLPPAVLFFTAIAMLSGLGMQATNVYLPLFAIETFDFSLVMGGITVTIAGVIGIISRLAWSRQMQSGTRPSTLLMIISFGAVGGVAALLAAAVWGSVTLLWVGTVIHGITVFGVNVVINAGLMRMIPANKIGTATGINSMGMYAGFALGPLIMGLIQDLTQSFTVGWMIMIIAYILCGVVAYALYRHTSKQEDRP